MPLRGCAVEGVTKKCVCVCIRMFVKDSQRGESSILRNLTERRDILYKKKLAPVASSV